MHRRRVRTQQDRLGLADTDEERVDRAARRVVERNVQCLEVVPVTFNLWPLGDLVSHADEDIFELLPDLGHEVEVSGERAGRTSVRSIRSAVRRSARATAASVWRLASTAGLEARPQLVQAPARLPALGHLHPTQLLIGGGETGALPKRLPLGLLELGERRGRGKTFHGLRLDVLELGRRIGARRAVRRLSVGHGLMVGAGHKGQARIGPARPAGAGLE